MRGNEYLVLSALSDQRATFAAFDGNQGNALDQRLHGTLGVSLSGDAAGLVFVGQEDIDNAQDFVQQARPTCPSGSSFVSREIVDPRP